MQQSKKIIAVKENYLFGVAYSKGKCHSAKSLALYVLKNFKNRDLTRVGITVSKNRRNAVVRNKMRRRIKEAYRQNHPYVKGGFLLVFVARQGSENVPFAVLESEMASLLQAAGLFLPGV